MSYRHKEAQQGSSLKGCNGSNRAINLLKLKFIIKS